MWNNYKYSGYIFLTRQTLKIVFSWIKQYNKFWKRFKKAININKRKVGGGGGNPNVNKKKIDGDPKQ